ncbi:hypothetical protein U8527_00930 [Kordia algicida OT-1]|uniref:Pectate lyase superfamily protein domain-containing protein n=1 Tax=Kordia algicida OT-1 TaxID=391587 RepID=A9DRY2_9FLAO|nr:hypothetical protein [Kordia algicida]EDP96859.1 hypothetical protein KAOT1_16888 [Kordia algicida OT-1]
MITVENMARLYNLTVTTIPNPNFDPDFPISSDNPETISNPDPYSASDGDIVYVQGFWDKNDGGSGLFIFEENSTLDPVFDDTSIFKVGYNENYDGMVCKAIDITDGRWIRQWDRGALNLRWFGARPDYTAGRDTSWALNAALKYAQFDPINAFPNDSGVSIFNSAFFTRPGKTIFIPSGRYKFYSAISDITFGVVIEGEGNMGTSAHGTRLYINQAYSSIPNYSQEESGFLRFVGEVAANNSGGGLKNLSIQVAEQTYDTNVISLLSPQEQTDHALYPTNEHALDYNPGVSKWTAENVFIVMSGLSKRALYMKSSQVGGVLPWRIRDIMLINCWFAGASVEGQTVRAENVSELQIIGGFFSSGTGVENDVLTPGIVLGGTYGCANTHLNGVDLSHSIIQIDEISTFINIDCRFGKLLIYNGPNNDHKALHVSKRFILNRRVHTNNDLVCDTATTPTNYKCYGYFTDIYNDLDADLITGWDWE